MPPAGATSCSPPRRTMEPGTMPPLELCSARSVQLAYPGVHPAPALDDRHLAEGQRPPCDPAFLPHRPLRETDDLLTLAHLLDEGAPLPAIRAPPEPLRFGVPAVGTNIKSLRSHVSIVLDRRKSTANKRSRGSSYSRLLRRPGVL